jgi:cell division protein FtsZ
VLDERMLDEMKITVIATGFDKAAEYAGDQTQATRLRAFPPATGGAIPTVPGRDGTTAPLNEPPSRSDLNVPTFLRKKAD